MSDYYPQGGPETAPPPPSGSNSLAIASLVCGIIGLFIFEIVLGPLAIVFGGLGLRAARRRGFALAGLIFGIIDVLVLILIIAVASKHNFSWHG